MRKWNCLWLGTDSCRDKITDKTLCTSENDCISGRTGGEYENSINPRWVHVGYSPNGNNNNQVFSLPKGLKIF